MSKNKDEHGTTGAGPEIATEPSATDTSGDDRPSEQTVGEAIQKEKEANEGVADLSEKRVRELARDEIVHWQANGPKLLQPKTWGRRTQVGAIAGTIVTLAVAILGFFNLDAKKLSGPPHSFVGTDGRVRDALDDYSQTGATSENPIFTLIGRTMRQAPVLAFHGEITFGRTFEVTLPDRECQERRRQEAKDLESEEFKDLPLPEGGEVVSDIDVEALCTIRGPIDFGLDLDIPFHARFFENSSESPHTRLGW